MKRRIAALLFLGACLLWAGSVMAQVPPSERPPVAPAAPAPEAAPAPAQQPAMPAPPPQAGMKRPIPEGPMPPPALGKWWKDSGIVSELKLTPEQITQLEKAFINHRLKLIDLRAALETNELKLEALLEEDRPEEQKVIAQIDQVTQARGNLEKENALMMLGVRRVLSVEQWQKLQNLQHRHLRLAPIDETLPHEGMPRKRSVPGGGAPPKRPEPTTPRPPEE